MSQFKIFRRSFHRIFFKNDLMQSIGSYNVTNLVQSLASFNSNSYLKFSVLSTVDFNVAIMEFYV